MPKFTYVKPKNVLGLDIGAKHTGVAKVIHLSVKSGFEGANVVLEQIEHKSTTTKLDCDRLEQVISAGVWDLIVVEDYRLYPSRVDNKGELQNATHFKTFSRLEEVQHLGVVKYLAGKYNIPLVLQNASDVKNLKKPTFRMSGHTTGTHTRDAINHVKKHFLDSKHKGRTTKF